MKEYVRVSLFSCGLGALLLLTSFSLSGTATLQWNGEKCLAGTQNGLPLPFMYSMNRSPITPPATHSTSVCSSGYNVSPVGTNLPNAVLDFLFWFAVSLPIVFGLNRLYRRKTAVEVSKEGEPEALSPDVAPTGR